MRVVDLEQREASAKRPGMFSAFKGHQRIVQAIAQPVSLCFTPTGRMTGKTEGDLMVAPILACLVAIGWWLTISAWLQAGRTNEREANRVIGALVGAVLVVGQDRGSECAALIGEVDPAMGGDLKLTIKGGGSFDGADIPVI